MTSRRLFWTLPVAAVALIGVTLWEQARSRVAGERTELRVARSMRSVGPELQFELYDLWRRNLNFVSDLKGIQGWVSYFWYITGLA